MVKKPFPRTGNMNRDMNKVREKTKLENKIGKHFLLLPEKELILS